MRRGAIVMAAAMSASANAAQCSLRSRAIRSLVKLLHRLRLDKIEFNFLKTTHPEAPQPRTGHGARVSNRSEHNIQGFEQEYGNGSETKLREIPHRDLRNPIELE